MPASHSDPADAFPTCADLFRDYAPFVWRVLRRLGVREADVDDVCQEVFVVVHRKLSTFEGRSSVRTWLYGISARVASDHRRRAHGSRETTSDVPDASVPPDQMESLALGQARQILDEILHRLDDPKREVFVLYEIEQLSMAEVAQALQCPLQTAYSRLHGARDEVDAAVRRIQKGGRA